MDDWRYTAIEAQAQRVLAAEARAAELQAEVERLAAELELWKPKPIMTDEEAEAIFGKD